MYQILYSKSNSSRNSWNLVYQYMMAHKVLTAYWVIFWHNLKHYISLTSHATQNQKECMDTCEQKVSIFSSRCASAMVDQLAILGHAFSFQQHKFHFRIAVEGLLSSYNVTNVLTNLEDFKKGKLPLNLAHAQLSQLVPLIGSFIWGSGTLNARKKILILYYVLQAEVSKTRCSKYFTSCISKQAKIWF